MNTHHDEIYLQAEELVKMIPALRSFARTFYRQKADADDLVQETLLKALANREKYLPISSLKSWLFTIMKNTFCTRIRIEKREAPAAAECVSTSHVSSVPGSQVDALEMQDVQNAIASLPLKYQRVLNLIVFEGKSYQRTAELCDCSIGTVKSRLFRARYKIHDIIDGENLHR